MKSTISNKRYESKVRKVLETQDFIVASKDELLIKDRINNGRRYFYIVLPRRENGNIVTRFLKIPCRNTKKLLEPFYRQLLIADYLKKNNIILTRGVIDSLMDKKSGTPFAVMETFPEGHSKIGFIDGFEKAKLLNETHAKNVIYALDKIHAVNPQELPISLHKILKPYKDEYKNLRTDMGKYLAKKVKSFDGNGEELFSKVLERRLGTDDIKRKTVKLVEKLKPIIFNEANMGGALIHGDMAPNNLYVYDNGDVELLDLEWVGFSKNKVMAMVIDYGNLRGRSWNNDIFSNALDENVIKIYADRGNAGLGKAIVSLAILRSHMMLAGFFENYEHVKQLDPVQKERREKTEQDIKKAWLVIGEAL